MKSIRQFLVCCLILVANSTAAFSQDQAGDSTKRYKTVVAGAEYKASSLHQWLWGSNYRTEWTTPVTVPIMMLDTAKGGLTPYRRGGGHQTRSLHCKNAGDKEYTLRSVNKTLSRVLPEILWGTFAEKQVNDEVSMAYPYGALAVPVMAQAAGVYHT